MSTQESFEAKVEFVKGWTVGGSRVTNEEKLTCYGLFKQATVGDCTTAKPSFIQFVERSKWDAWQRRKGMGKEEAMAAYIAEVDAQHAKYGD